MNCSSRARSSGTLSWSPDLIYGMGMPRESGGMIFIPRPHRLAGRDAILSARRGGRPGFLLGDLTGLGRIFRCGQRSLQCRKTKSWSSAPKVGCRSGHLRCRRLQRPASARQRRPRLEQAAGWRSAANMTAGFPALGHNNINAAVHGTACFLCRAHRMQHDSAAVLGPRHKSRRILPEERDDRGTLFKTGCKALLLREVEVQIDPERPVCKRPRLPELSPDCVSVGSPQHQHAGVANRCRECRTDGSGHRSLGDRHLNPEPVTGSCHASVLARPF